MCMDSILQDLLNRYSFLTTSFFSMFSLRYTLVCSLKKLVLLSHRNLYYRLIGFTRAMQQNFLSFCVFQPVLLGSSCKTL